MTTLRSQVFNASPAAVAFSEETPDVMTLLAFLFKDQIIAHIEQEIDAVADDKAEAALSEPERETKLAEIAVDFLATERMECALIRIAEVRSEVLDYRHDTSPQSLLGVVVVTVPYREPDYNGHSFAVSHGGRR